MNTYQFRTCCLDWRQVLCVTGGLLSAYERTSIPALCVQITIKEIGDHDIRVIAVPIRAEDGSIIEELGIVTGRRTSRKRQQHAVNAVIKEMEERYVEIFSIQPMTKEEFLAEYEAIKADVEHNGFRLRDSWTIASTNLSKLTYTYYNIFPLLYPFLDPKARLVLESDRQSIEDHLVQRFIARAGGSVEHARSEIGKRLVDADCILANMRDRNPRIPMLHLASSTPIRRLPSVEQAKDLPRSLLMRFYRSLVKLIDSLPKLVFFVVLVVFGLRPAEAAARKPCEIVWYDTYCTLEVTSQERNGKCDKRLKNKYSRRIIIISYWGMTLLKMCCEKIGDDYPQDDTAMNDAVECSREVKNMLRTSGLAVETMEKLSEEITDDDLDDDTPKGEDPRKLKQVKIACYILRRIFASILRNEMGMSMYITDRLLGHVPVKTGSKYMNPDLNSPDVQRAVAEAMERYIFDLRYSLNPACRPYMLSEHDSITTNEFSEYVFENDTDSIQVLHINEEAAEPGERIKVWLEDGSMHDLIAISTPKSWENIRHIVIGDTTIPKEE